MRDFYVLVFRRVTVDWHRETEKEWTTVTRRPSTGGGAVAS